MLIHALALRTIGLFVGNHFIVSVGLRWKTSRNSFWLFIRLHDSWLYFTLQCFSAAREGLKEPRQYSLPGVSLIVHCWWASIPSPQIQMTFSSPFFSNSRQVNGCYWRLIKKVERCPENGRNVGLVNKSWNRKPEKTWVPEPTLL